jgi:hypothetical protein
MRKDLIFFSPMITKGLKSDELLQSTLPAEKAPYPIHAGAHYRRDPVQLLHTIKKQFSVPDSNRSLISTSEF